MSGEQVRNSGTTPQVFLLPLTTPDGKDVNIFLLLTLLQKGTLDFDGEYRKYAAQKQADGEFLVNLMKMLEEAVSKNGTPLKYKDVEKMIDRFFKNHDIRNMSPTELIALHDIKSMCKELKNKDVKISDLMSKVAHDNDEYQKWEKRCETDKIKIDEAQEKAKHYLHDAKKHWYNPKRVAKDMAKVTYWSGVADFYFLKLKLTDGPNRDKWAAKLVADSLSLKAAIEDEDCFFGSISSKWSIKGQLAKSIGDYETQTIDRSDKNIIEFSRHLIENSTV